MKYRLSLTSEARKALRKLDKQTLRLVDARILSLAEDPRPHGCKKLVGSDDLYRIRSGQYRIIYKVEDDVLLVLVVRVSHRRDVYRSTR